MAKDFGRANCKQCGCEFQKHREVQLYCSEQCRDVAKKMRKRQGRSGDTKATPTQTPRSGDTAVQGASDGLRMYVWPDTMVNPTHGTNPDGSTPGALRGDDFPLEYYEDGFPKLPACLDRRKPKVERLAA